MCSRPTANGSTTTKFRVSKIMNSVNIQNNISLHSSDACISSDSDSQFEDEIVNVFMRDVVTGMKKIDMLKQYTMVKVPNQMGVMMNNDNAYYDAEAELNYKVKKARLMKFIKLQERIEEEQRNDHGASKKELD